MNGHPAAHGPGGHGQSPPEADPLRPLHIADKTSAAELVDRMADTAFQARNLGQSARIWDAMLRDKTTIFFGLAGAMVPAGMRPVIVYLIENHLVDVIVSTGANLFHDVYETLGFAHAQGDPDGDDVRLAHLRVVRLHGVLANAGRGPRLHHAGVLPPVREGAGAGGEGGGHPDGGGQARRAHLLPGHRR
jgi:deoxyhypusine synthase